MTEIQLGDMAYKLYEKAETKCNITRMKQTLPEDVVEDYVKQNTVMVTKFEKKKIVSDE